MACALYQGNTCTWSHTHTHTYKVDTLWGYQLQHTIVGFIRCFTYFFSPDRWKERRVGEGGREGERVEKRIEGVFLFSFFFESKLNLNFVLPYADLRRNVPYAQKFIRQAIPEANTEWDFILSKFKAHCQRRKCYTSSAAGEHSCGAVK